MIPVLRKYQHDYREKDIKSYWRLPLHHFTSYAVGVLNLDVSIREGILARSLDQERHEAQRLCGAVEGTDGHGDFSIYLFVWINSYKAHRQFDRADIVSYWIILSYCIISNIYCYFLLGSAMVILSVSSSLSFRNPLQSHGSDEQQGGWSHVAREVVDWSRERQTFAQNKRSAESRKEWMNIHDYSCIGNGTIVGVFHNGHWKTMEKSGWAFIKSIEGISRSWTVGCWLWSMKCRSRSGHTSTLHTGMLFGHGMGQLTQLQVHAVLRDSNAWICFRLRFSKNDSISYFGRLVTLRLVGSMTDIMQTRHESYCMLWPKLNIDTFWICLIFNVLWLAFGLLPSLLTRQ